MQQPFDYTIKGIQDPASSFMQGFERATAFKALEAQRAMEAQYQNDLAEVSASPTVDKIKYMMTRYPAQAEKFKSVLANMTEEQKAAKIDQLNSVYAPLVSGRKDIALKNIERLIEASSNSGDKASIGQLQTIRDMLASDQTGGAGDSMATFGMGSFLAAAMGPDKFAENYGKLSESAVRSAEMPTKLSKAESDAKTAAVTAKYAESEAMAKLKETQARTVGLEQDVEYKKSMVEIARMNARIAAANNDIQRQKLILDRDRMALEQAEKLEAKQALGQKYQITTDNTLDTIDEILATPKNIVRRAIGPVASKLPTYDPAVASFEQLASTLQAQVFMEKFNELRGAGQITEKEGEKAQNSIRSLSREQSPESFIYNIGVIKGILEKGRANMQKRYGFGPRTKGQPGSGGAVEVEF